MKKRQRSQQAQIPDPILANRRPTAVSAEFVPKPVPEPAAGFTTGSDEVFDLIPELKGDKFV